MKSRIERLLKDSRLDVLIYTDSRFYGAKVKLKNGNVTNQFLDDIEKHIKNIDPHIEIIQINGENVPVEFITRLDDNDG